MKDWRFWLTEQRGTLLALGIFVVMFAIYLIYHPAIANRGFNEATVSNVVQTAANKGVLLAFVAMAQALVVLTAGIDLSVGMTFTLTNCLASWIVVGSAFETTLGVIGVLATGALCGGLNGVIVIFGRLQPIVTTIATGAIYFGVALALRPYPGGSVNGDLADLLTGKVFDLFPASLVVLLVVVLVVWVPFSRSVTGRAAYAVGSSEVAAYMSGVPIKRAKLARLHALRRAGLDRRPVPDLLHLYRRSGLRLRQHLHPFLHRRGRARRRLALRRHRQRDRRRFSARSHSAPSAISSSSSISIRCGSRCSRALC